jgi:hypothetical protein
VVAIVRSARILCARILISLGHACADLGELIAGSGNPND